MTQAGNTAAIECPRCSGQNPREARFCMTCGQPLAAETEDEPQRQARLTANAPGSLLEKLRSAPITGERKPVTAVFADVVGSTTLAETMDPEEWTAIINTAFEAMSAAIFRYEGTLAQLQGDALVAFFGAPVAHEDDPERAVRAALEMVADVERLGRELHGSHGIDFHIRVGINTGPVLVGNVGSDLRFEYTAIGDAMNVAARVEAAAEPGSVLVTEATRRLISGVFETADLGTTTVKGRRTPVRMYRVVGLKIGGRRERGIEGLGSRVVGRDAELAQLAAVIERVRRGQAAAAVIIGEPGIGKSRLLRELRATVMSGVWAEGRCLSFGRGMPYHLITDLLRGLADATGRGLVDGRRLEVDRWLDDIGVQAADAADSVSHLLSLPLDDRVRERLERLDADVLRDRYLTAVRAIVEATARRQPLMLVAEDVHWADSASVAVLTSLMQIAGAPILLLATLRPEPESEGIRLVDAARDAFGDALLEIRLDALTTDESRELVGNLLEIETLPPEVRELILSKSEGNPFFVEELIRMLIDESIIVRRKGKWVGAGRSRTVTVPDTLRGLLLARIDRLADAARRALQISSVIGRRFRSVVLDEVLRSDGGQGLADEALETLVAADLLQADDAAGVTEYAFRHALIQDAAYEALLRRERVVLHRAVAQTLERLHPEQLDSLAAELMRHYREAGDLPIAADWAYRAAAHAERRSAMSEARELYEAAGQWLPDEPGNQRRQVEIALGRARSGFYVRSFEDEITRVEAVAPVAEALGDPRLLVHLYHTLAFLLSLRGDQYDASPRLREITERAVALGGTLGDDPIRARPLMTVGTARMLSGRFAEAAEVLEQAVPLFRSAGEPVWEAEANMNLLMSLARLGRFDDAEAAMDRATELAEITGNRAVAIDTESGLAVLRSERGQFGEALAAAERAAEQGEAEGVLVCAAFGHLVKGEVCYRSGDPASAVRSLERSSRLARRLHAAFIENLGRANLNAARWELGERDSARAGWASALEAAKSTGDRFGEAEILARRGAAIAEEDPLAGAGDLRAAIAILEGLQTRPALARAQLDLAKALRRHGSDAEADGLEATGRQTLADLGLSVAVRRH